MFKYRAAPWALLIATLACAGNDADPLSPLRGDEVIFLAQTVPSTVVMEALFQGRIFVDSAGCVRLDSPDQHTVVWPHGFVLQERGDELWVRAPGGRDIGRLGASFRFGGGEVPALHAGIALASDGRQRAAESCPGRFWIVGDVP